VARTPHLGWEAYRRPSEFEKRAVVTGTGSGLRVVFPRVMRAATRGKGSAHHGYVASSRFSSRRRLHRARSFHRRGPSRTASGVAGFVPTPGRAAVRAARVSTALRAATVSTGALPFRVRSDDLLVVFRARSGELRVRGEPRLRERISRLLLRPHLRTRKPSGVHHSRGSAGNSRSDEGPLALHRDRNGCFYSDG
jgi:hypothetical protein